jgi:orotate phosphoribosyltransferase
MAIVDDVVIAGSALRGTFAELTARGAETVVAGALMVLGTHGNDFFAQQGVAVESLGQEDFELWAPDTCPRCAAGEPLETRNDASTP